MICRIRIKDRNLQMAGKASILRYSAFFTVQLSHPYMTTGKTIALSKKDLKCPCCELEVWKCVSTA